MPAELTTSVNGTIEDVAAFFRVSIRTVREWKAERPPRIAFWQVGRNVMCSEEAVVECKAAHLVASRRMAPGEAADQARREWREHLGLRRAEGALVRRVEAIEEVLKNGKWEMENGKGILEVNGGNNKNHNERIEDASAGDREVCVRRDGNDPCALGRGWPGGMGGVQPVRCGDGEGGAAV